MAKRFVRGCTLFLLLGLVGCGRDERDGLINETIAQIDRATSVLGNIKDTLQKGLKTAEDEKRAVNAADFDKIVKEIIPELKEVGGNMQALKRQTESLRDKITTEERKTLADKFTKRTEQALTSLREEQAALSKLLQKAQGISEEAVRELKQRLAEAQGEFEVIAKLR